MTKETASAFIKSWRALSLAAGVALGVTGAAHAAENHTGAWGLISTMGAQNPYDAVWLVTGDPTSPSVHNNLIYVNMDMQYNFPSYGQWESATWRPASSFPTQRFTASLLGTDWSSSYPMEGRYIQLRNLTLERADLDAQNVRFRFYPIPPVPGASTSLTLNNASLTGLIPPGFNVDANLTLTASGDSTLSGWGKGPVSSQTTLNVTPGGKLTLFRLGQQHGTYATDSWYFSQPGNVATIDGGTLKLDQSFVTFGQPSIADGQMTFQNGATLELVNESTKLEAGKVSFINSSLNVGLGVTKLTVDDTLTFNGASVTIADSAAKLKTQVLRVFGSNSIALPQEYSPTNYSVTAGVMLMEPDSILTLNGQGSLASDNQLLWTLSPSGHYGQIIINDNASLVNNGGDFKIIPGARITINRSGNVSGALIVKNGGIAELLGSSSYYANFSNRGVLSAESNGTIAVSSGTFNILGGSQGVISIGSDGRLVLGNFGTAAGASAVLNTDNSVELDYFSTLQMTIDPTALKNSQLRSASEVTIANFADLNLGLVNDRVLPNGTKFVLIDYTNLNGTGGVAGVASKYFNGYRDGSSFVLGMNRYQINYKDSGDAGFAGAVTLTVIPLVPPVATLSPTPQTISGTVGASITPSASMVPSNFGGTVTYSINPALPSGLKFDLVKGVISGTSSQALAATAFTIRGVGSTSGDANAIVNLAIAKANQSISFGPAPSANYSPGGVFLVSASASSSLAIIYSNLTPLVCSAGSGSVTILNAGTCTVAANQAGDANYNAATQVTQNIAIAKAAQAPLVLSAAPTSITVAATSALSISGGSGTGAISYGVNSGPCSIVGTTLNGNATGTCTVTASQAADANYNAIASNPVTVNVSLGTQAALSLNASPSTINTNGSSTLSTTGGSGTGSVTYAVTSGSCTISGSVLTSTVAGSCSVVATKAADATYGSASSSAVTVTVNLSSQSALVLSANPASLNVNDTSSLSSSGGSGTGAVSYTVVSGPCSITGSTLTATGAGTCSVSASKAADGTYSAATSAPVSVTVGLAPQASLVLSASPGSVSVGATSTLSTSGGSGTGTVSYSLSGGPCTLVGNTLTGTGSGSCLVTATKAASTVYAAATSNPVAVSVALASQTALVMNASPSTINVNGTSALGTSGGSGTGAVTYSVNSGPCSITASTLTGTGQGLCYITATKAGDASYGAATSSPVTVTVNLATQTALVLTATPPSINANGSSTLSTTGGSGAGAVSYAVTSGSCTVSGTALTSTVAGSCTVVATKAADSSYGAASSAPVTVTVNLAPQATLVLTASPTSISAGGTSTLSTSGGNGTGAVSYTVTSGSCTVIGNALIGAANGTCTVTATKAADGTYSAMTSAPVSVATLASFVLIASPTAINVNGTSTLSTSGGQGSGAVSYSLVSGPCSITGSTLSGTGQGQCQVSASKATDGTYPSATSNPVTVTVNLLAPSALVLSASPTMVGFGGSSTLSTSGGIPGGAVTYSLSGPCYVTGNTLTGTSDGSCQVSATQAATSVYSAPTSNTVTVTVRERTTVFSYPQGSVSATATIGQLFTLTPVTAGFTNPTFALLYGNLPDGLTLDPHTGVISGRPSGNAGTFDGVISVFENNAYDAALFVITVQAAVSPAAIPTLSEWGLIILSSLMAMLAFAMRRKLGDATAKHTDRT